MKNTRRRLLVAFFSIIGFLALIPLITYAFFVSDLQSKESLTRHNDSGIILLDIKNRPFFTFYQAKFKEEIPLSDIPKSTQLAVIAMEDKDFYSHPGFSPKAMLRALVSNISNKDLSYGASTLTQQLVKISLLSSRKDFLRKYQEIILAQEIERRYKKDEILAMYLNSVYFGEGAFGIEEASQTYFNKSAKDLDLAQSAILVAILPAPGKLSPMSGHLDQAKLRQKIVLQKMAEQNYISSSQADEASKKQLTFTQEKPDINVLAPHFALMVRDQLIQKYGEENVLRSGFKVKTTLNLDWQEYAEKIVTDQVKNLQASRVSNGSAVVLDSKTGEIRVMVGSTNWYEDSFGKVNMAEAPRPPGSSFKPIIYIKALEKGAINMATVLKDQPTSFANFDESNFFASFPTKAMAQEFLKTDPNAFYKPKNYDGRFRGPVTVRRALSNSLNIPAVEVMKKIGLDDGIEMAKRLGITTITDKSNYGLSFVLGTADVKLLELTNVYATFANKGLKNEPTAILEISDNNGKTIYKSEPKNEPVLDEKDVFFISSILSDNNSRKEVFGDALTISRPAAVKTGTTEDYKDAWTMGYTPYLAVGVWVGNNFGEPMNSVAGSLGAAPIWKALMEKFSADFPKENFEPPSGVVKQTVCFGEGKESSMSASEYFIEGTQAKTGCKLLHT